jgi:hypothetical protein
VIAVGLVIFIDRRKTGKEPKDQKKERDRSKKIERFVIAEKQQQGPENFETVPNGPQLGTCPLGAFLEGNSHLAEMKALVHGLDGQFHFEFKAAGEDGNVLVESP